MFRCRFYEQFDRFFFNLKYVFLDIFPQIIPFIHGKYLSSISQISLVTKIGTTGYLILPEDRRYTTDIPHCKCMHSLATNFDYTLLLCWSGLRG